MTVPEQCRTCRHVIIEDGEACCIKPTTQHREPQELMVISGYCRLLNPSNDCADYEKSWFG